MGGSHASHLGSAPQRSLVHLLVLAAAALLALGIFGSSSGAVGRPTCAGEPATKFGGPNRDVLVGGPNRDVIIGGGGVDSIDGNGGRDLICGDGGEGTPAGDVIKGGGNRDVIFGEGGNDIIEGEDGNDVLHQNASIHFGVLRGGPDNDSLYGGAGDDRLRGGGGIDGLHGHEGDDDLSGGANDDFLYGGPENDDLNGGDGNDFCEQGPGSGAIDECDADLAVHVSGPDSAPPGQITYTVDVKNNGPSAVNSYRLFLEEENENLACGGPQPWAGNHTFDALAPGHTRTRNYSSTCTNPDLTGVERLHAVVSRAEPADDPNLSNNSRRKSTVVSE
jgi:hypothetical protein